MSEPYFILNGVRYRGYKVSNSKVNSYLSCPQKHYFSYVEKLRKKGVERPIVFGGDFHKLLELKNKPKAMAKARSRIKEVYNDLNPRQRGDLGETYLEDLDSIFGDYLDTWSDTEQPIETEHEFLIPIGKLSGEIVYFHGKIDEIYDDQSIGEHKTFNKQPDMAILAMNTQVCLYAKAYELETGNKLDSVRWDYIKSKPATKPIWLDKSGRFSEATNSNITRLSWLRACREKGIEDESILNKANLYKHNISNFFFRVRLQIVPQMVETVWRDFKSVCKDIVQRGQTNKTKNITRDCTWCDYRPICYAEFTGADVNYIKSTDYIIKEEK